MNSLKPFDENSCIVEVIAESPFEARRLAESFDVSHEFYVYKTDYAEDWGGNKFVVEMRRIKPILQEESESFKTDVLHARGISPFNFDFLQERKFGVNIK